MKATDGTSVQWPIVSYGVQVEIDFAVLARSADLGADGTISALGMGFDRIRATVLPRAFPFAVLVRLKEIGDAEKLLVELDVIGPKGSILDAPFVNEMPIKKAIPSVAVIPKETATIHIGLPGLVIPEAGKYEFQIRVTATNTVNRSLSVSVEQGDV